MTLTRLVLGVAFSALIVSGASAHTRHHHHRHHHAMPMSGWREAPDARDYQRPMPSDAPPMASGPVNLITNGPIPDTPENRARYGDPISHGGRATMPVGN